MKRIEDLRQATAVINEHIQCRPQIGLILGSGLGDLADRIEQAVFIDYCDIPHFPIPTVEGHTGQIVIGDLEGKSVLAFKGRFHYYEGYTMDEVVFGVRCLKLLGAAGLIVTNAAGSLTPEFQPGQLMLIRDHIKMVFDSPLRGANLDQFGPRFNDMSDPYDTDLRTMALECAQSEALDLKEGVYCYMPGPSYETASEVKMLGLLGGHAVGMSTVPEVITANHAGMKVLGLSILTNMGTGIVNQPLAHQEVIETGQRAKNRFFKLLLKIIRRWPA